MSSMALNDPFLLFNRVIVLEEDIDIVTCAIEYNIAHFEDDDLGVRVQVVVGGRDCV